MYLADDSRFDVLKTYSESDDKSLEKRTLSRLESSEIEKKHIRLRKESEISFFSKYVNENLDKSNYVVIPKGSINDNEIVNEIKKINPDLLICYGSSLIKSDLIKFFKNRFLNVHLGLSPYYRGSGTNVWPIILDQFNMLGATFMYIDEGIDTGNIIHQFREKLMYNDTPHTVGNRIIKKMSATYADIIVKFLDLKDEVQPSSISKVFYEKDFNAEACNKLYANLSKKKIQSYLLNNKNKKNDPYIVKNKALKC